MHRFVDETQIQIKAGNGGAGAVSFRHEKFVEFGGPDGGDGGRGGDVYFLASPSVPTLSHIRHDRKYYAGNGKSGRGQNKSGAKGKDLTIKLPLGTQLLDLVSQKVIHDFIDDEPFLAAEGGRGGKGNAFFKSSTRQSPRFAQSGEEREPLRYLLSLKLIADVGLVGLPNAGKSSLLKALTHANPRIAGYPFTTLSPNLGVMELSLYQKIHIADIPGIIEGAAKGIGLGISFLKHIERVKLLLLVLDVNSADVRAELEIIRKELDSYNPVLNKRPFLVVFNKIDLIEDLTFLQEWIASFYDEGIYPLAVSARKKQGLMELKEEIAKKLAGHL